MKITVAVAGLEDFDRFDVSRFLAPVEARIAAALAAEAPPAPDGPAARREQIRRVVDRLAARGLPTQS